MSDERYYTSSTSRRTHLSPGRGAPSRRGSPQELLTSPGTLRTTPRTSVQTLDSRRPLGLSPAEGYELNLYGESGQRRAPTQEVSLTGEVQYTQTIEEDLQVLRDVGFEIIYPDGHLGYGFYGDVYRGVYGENAVNLRDVKGEPLRNVGPGQPFAVKFVDFTQEDSILGNFGAPSSHAGSHSGSQTNIKTIDKRESYEIEKLIMTLCDHKNITPIRMAINMGEPSVFQYQNSTDEFVQHDRVYLIMDFADKGSVRDYMDQLSTLTVEVRLKITTDLFRGLEYLHRIGIIHGDVHSGNVLLFEESGQIVAKWTDFGLGIVNKKNEYKFRSKYTEQELKEHWEESVKLDIKRYAAVLGELWTARRREMETPDDTSKWDRTQKLIKALKKNDRDLPTLRPQFEDILSDQRVRVSSKAQARLFQD